MAMLSLLKYYAKNAAVKTNRPGGCVLFDPLIFYGLLDRSVGSGTNGDICLANGVADEWICCSFVLSDYKTIWSVVIVHVQTINNLMLKQVTKPTEK